MTPEVKLPMKMKVTNIHAFIVMTNAVMTIMCVVCVDLQNGIGRSRSIRWVQRHPTFVHIAAREK